MIFKGAFIVQNQTLLLQICKRKTFFCDMSDLMHFKKILDKTLKNTNCIILICGTKLFLSLLTSIAIHKTTRRLNYMPWQRWKEITISTEERSKLIKKKKGYIVRTHLKTSTPIFHSVKSEPSKSSWAHVLLSIIQRFCTKMNSLVKRSEARRRYKKCSIVTLYGSKNSPLQNWKSVFMLTLLWNSLLIAVNP